MLIYTNYLKAKKLTKNTYIYRKVLNLFIILYIKSIVLRKRFVINRIIVLL